MVRDAKSGTAVEITRIGKSVAVLVCATTYRQPASGSPSFGKALDDFLDLMEIGELGLERGEFGNLRNRAPSRGFRW